MKLVLCAALLFCLGLFRILGSDTTQAVESFHREVPFIPLQELQRIIGKEALVWSWHWKDLGPARYTPEIRKQVDDDVQATLARPGEHPKWYQSPMKIANVLENPTRPFLYFVLEPASDETLDANLVYVYDTKQKTLLFKTYADFELDYKDFQ